MRGTVQPWVAGCDPKQEMIMTAATVFAAYEQAIWGTGPTKDAAVADCTQWVNAEDAANLLASVKTAPMSADLAEHVATVGGNCAFELRNGVLEIVGA